MPACNKVVHGQLRKVTLPAMDETFELPVLYRNVENCLPARLVTMGYTYKIFVTVDGTEVTFEPDEERHLRAVIDPLYEGKLPPVDYIITITEALEKLLRE